MITNSNSVYRFAPSPSGYLHVGGARTAIFNWLLARKEYGKFLLRIEDTDRSRSTDQAVKQIITSLQWLGLDWDEEPLFQSHRLQRHNQVVKQLLERDRAYFCFCSKEIIEEQKQKSQRNKKTFLYDKRCRRLKKEEVAHNLASGKSYAVRLKVPEGKIHFNDSIHGETVIDSAEIDDFVIQRSDKTPVYQLAVVIDDHDMHVTHVLRGDDHFSNTPKQLLIYRAMEWPAPSFGHLPLILGKDKQRLSKRHGATSVEELSQMGILPQALFNFLCLLGWSPGDDREIMDRKELIQLFSLERVNKANAVFDEQKLIWMNGKYLSMTSNEQVVSLLKRDLDDSEKKILSEDSTSFLHFVQLLKERARTLNDMRSSMDYFFYDPTVYDQEGVDKYFKKNNSLHLLQELKILLTDMKDFSALSLEPKFRYFAQKEDLKLGELIHPLRLALTGRLASPGIFEIMEILGEKKVQRRISKAIDFIQSHSN
jgi:glutamyl-tRNA synthetase